MFGTAELSRAGNFFNLPGISEKMALKMRMESEVNTTVTSSERRSLLFSFLFYVRTVWVAE